MRAIGRRSFLLAFTAVVTASLSPVGLAQTNPLPSWNDGPSKQAILKFVTAAVMRGGSGYIAPADRIAVFDNDGTLWAEQPIYFQFAFAIDRIRELAPQHPEWKTTQPFQAIIEGDMKAFAASGERGIGEVLAASSTGMTTDEYARIVSNWLRTARHPRFRVEYTDLVYQPMLELLSYLRANSFKTFIVSGGEADFMRVFAQRVYGIPPEQVVGTTMETTFQMNGGKPSLMREPKLEFVDDGPGKPVGINKYIGHRPVFAFGNSDGDQQMLQWTAAGTGPRFMGIVHHTDAEREFAYDRESSVGKLDKAWDEANEKGWTVVDMKAEWKRIFKGPAK
ncbi:MAG TPA: HAD family hydrolase [Vicinamibacterales bacterium]|jgi:phosphoglycolate phosphatase-like HAD superfamily hydrolase